MHSVKIKAELSQAREVAELGFDGERLEDNKRRHFIASIPVSVESSDRTVDLEFFIRGEVAIKDALAFDEAIRAQVVADAMIRSCDGHFSKRSEWRIEGESWVPVTVLLQEAKKSQPPIELDLDVTLPCFEYLSAQTAYRKSVKVAFAKARDFLSDKLRGPIEYDRERVLAAVRYITMCCEAELDPVQPYRDYDFARRLSESVNDMLRRSSLSHPGYQRSRERASEAAFMLHCPIWWREQPPDPSYLDL